LTRPDDEKQKYLDYAGPDRRFIARNVGVTIGGAIVGALLISLAGCGTFAIGDFPLENTTGKPPSLLTSIVFFAFALAAAVGVILSAQRRKWFLIGCCLGAGLMCLVEGACFGGIG